MRVATVTPPINGPERESRAFLRLLADICRRFPDLRGWLVEDFARDAKVRANFLGLVETDDLGDEDTADAFAEMARRAGLMAGGKTPNAGGVARAGNTAFWRADLG